MASHPMTVVLVSGKHHTKAETQGERSRPQRPRLERGSCPPRSTEDGQPPPEAGRQRTVPSRLHAWSLQRERGPAGSSMLDFQPPEPGENKRLWREATLSVVLSYSCPRALVQLVYLCYLKR